MTRGVFCRTEGIFREGGKVVDGTLRGFVFVQNDMEKENELPSFHFVFLITKRIVFEVNYYRLGGNEHKHFSTQAARLNKPRSDYNICGQAQTELLFNGGAAMHFFRKWDHLHTEAVNKDEHAEILADIERLKEKYIYIEKHGDPGFGFSDIVELSRKKPLKIRK